MIPDLLQDPFRLTPDDMNPSDELGVRNLLIAYHLTVEKRERLEGVARAVAAAYSDRLSSIEAELAGIRQSLSNYVTVNGSVSLPDVGGCHLTQRKAALRVADRAALEEWAEAHGFIRSVPDLDEAKVEATQLFLQGGEVVPGMELHEPDASLTIRKAA